MLHQIQHALSFGSEHPLVLNEIFSSLAGKRPWNRESGRAKIYGGKAAVQKAPQAQSPSRFHALTPSRVEY